MDETHDTVTRMDHQLTEQRALLLAMAEEQGLDGEQILAEAAIDEAELGDEADDSSTMGIRRPRATAGDTTAE